MPRERNLEPTESKTTTKPSAKENKNDGVLKPKSKSELAQKNKPEAYAFMCVAAQTSMVGHAAIAFGNLEILKSPSDTSILQHEQTRFLGWHPTESWFGNATGAVQDDKVDERGNPDNYQTCACTLISREQFNLADATIKNWQGNQYDLKKSMVNGEDYDVRNSNCTHFVDAVVKSTGLQVPVRKGFIYDSGPNRVDAYMRHEAIWVGTGLNCGLISGSPLSNLEIRPLQ